MYRAVTALYDKYRLSNIGQAKRSKLLHLKRPWLVPIADTRVTAAYRDRSAAWAEELGIASGHWEAAREDLTAAVGDFEWLTAKLRTHREPAIQRLSRLTSLRISAGGDVLTITATRITTARKAARHPGQAARRR